MKHWTKYRIDEGFTRIQVKYENKILIDPAVFVAERIWKYKK